MTETSGDRTAPKVSAAERHLTTDPGLLRPAPVESGVTASQFPHIGISFRTIAAPLYGTTDIALDNAPVLRAASIETERRALLDAADHLSVDERTRSTRFARQADRERFILGRLLVRSVLTETFGIDEDDCDFETGAHGKPSLRNRPEIAFNIAHSGDIVLVGAGTGIALGVDVERHRCDVEWEGIGRIVFTRAEQDHVLRGTPDQRIPRFFRQWTLKEAIAKALGTGLSLDPRRFCIDMSVHPRQPTFVGSGQDDIGHGWFVAEIELAEGYSAAAAWRVCGGTRPVQSPMQSPITKRG